QIDDAAAGSEHMMPVVDFGELEGGAGAQALRLGARHIRIVELALEPKLGRERASLAGLDPHLERPGATLVGADHRAPSFARVHTPSSRMSCTSMPSRSPRSATRRRSHGKARRIASRMAQPA